MGEPKYGLTVTILSQDIPPPALDYSVIPMLRDVPDSTLIRERPWEHQDPMLRALAAQPAYNAGLGGAPVASPFIDVGALNSPLNSPRTRSPRAGSPLHSPRNRLAGMGVGSGIFANEVPSGAHNDDLY